MASVEILKAARAKIADPRHWVQNISAVDADGLEVDASSKSACAWCAIGALESEGCRLDELQLLGDIADKHFGVMGAWTVNDSIGHEAVMRLYDLAIAAVEAGDA